MAWVRGEEHSHGEGGDGAAMSCVSVIMSTYCRNRAGFQCRNLLRRAIDSVLGQTLTDFELVLIDDGSKDGSADICREYAAKDKRIRLFRHEVNSGRSAQRYNEGMKAATTGYFTFMFDDDLWMPSAIETLYGAITGQHNGCGMVYGFTELVDTQTGKKYPDFGDAWSMAEIYKKNILGNLSVIVTRQAINSVGGYDESPLFRRCCDWDLWMRIGAKFPVARIPKMIGTSFVYNKDSVGMTVGLSNEDLSRIRAIQKRPDRVVQLQGEMVG